MILIDSCGWIEFLADGPLAREYEPFFVEESKIITPTIVLYEVFKKVQQEQGKEKALVVTAQIQKTRLVPFDEYLAIMAADASLRWNLPLADAIVYATAIYNKSKVVTSDQHFCNLPEVIFIGKCFSSRGNS